MKSSRMIGSLLCLITLRSSGLLLDASVLDNSVADDGDLSSILSVAPSASSLLDSDEKQNEKQESTEPGPRDVSGIDDDDNLSTLEMIKREGYPAQSHRATTSDGYVLTIHRIPGPEGSTAVFLQHGLLCSSADWVIPGRGRAIAYLLADKGYDVWLGNARGNTYSRSHCNLSTSDPKFWDFSWHEMGIYDLPAALGYVAERKSDSIIYIGHSMGTTMFYAMATRRPDIAEKIRVMIGLAPVAFVDHLKSPVRFVAPFADDIELVAKFTGRDEFLPNSALLRFLAKYGCEIDTAEEKICTNAMFVLVGFDSQQFNYTLLPKITNHTPAGTSTKTVVHYCQEIVSGHFREYDYGRAKNNEYYNSSTPPDYDLSSIAVPVALIYADNDWLASPSDVKHLWEELPAGRKIDCHRVDFAKFNHVDFMWAIDAPKLVYRRVFEILARYTDSD